MKTPRFLLPILLGLLVCPWQVPAQNGPDKEKAAIDTLLDRWHRDAANASLDAYFDAMTPDAVFIGTDASEHWTAKEFREWCRPHFDRKKTWNFTPFRRHIHLASTGQTAWFDELLVTQMGVCRGSGAALKVKGQWKITHYVLSATIPNSVMKQVTALKSASDSMIILRDIFDRHNMDGALIILDPAKGTYCGYNSALWDSGFLPASTFKVPNSIIGLETGVVDTNFIFKWNGEKRRLPQWEKDLTLKEAFRVSCVPCYQEVARRIGPDRMKGWLEAMGYPGMDVRPETIDLFWLEGNSRITPRQQVDFIRRFYDKQLPIKPSTCAIMKEIMVNEETAAYKLSGKTGWAVRNGNNYGWFIGYLETGGKVYFSACLVIPKDQQDLGDFTAARKLITMEAFRALGVVK